MNDLLLFLTSEEIMIVYVISAIACVICLTVYLIEKKNEKIRRKHNTKELNKLVELVKERVEPQNIETYDEPILEESNESNSLITDMISNIEAKEETCVEEVYIPEEEPILKIENQELPVVSEEIKYTSIEPDQETAQIELKKLEEELVKEEQEKIEENNNIELTKFEEEQEKTAIISLEELLQKSRELYELNELKQYTDEGNEPISIQDLEKKMDKSVSRYAEPFIIANVVENDDTNETKVEVIDQNIKEQINMEKATVPSSQQDMVLSIENIKVEESVIEDAMNNEPVIEHLSTEKVSEVKEEPVRTFKRSPYISPIFGIERENNLELENTANYDKLDEEIKKTNNFVMTLKELQEKLD